MQLLLLLFFHVLFQSVSLHKPNSWPSWNWSVIHVITEHWAKCCLGKIKIQGSLFERGAGVGTKTIHFHLSGPVFAQELTVWLIGLPSAGKTKWFVLNTVCNRITTDNSTWYNRAMWKQDREQISFAALMLDNFEVSGHTINLTDDFRSRKIHFFYVSILKEGYIFQIWEKSFALSFRCKEASVESK